MGRIKGEPRTAAESIADKGNIHRQRTEHGTAVNEITVANRDIPGIERTAVKDQFLVVEGAPADAKVTAMTIVRFEVQPAISIVEKCRVCRPGRRCPKGSTVADNTT